MTDSIDDTIRDRPPDEVGDRRLVDAFVERRDELAFRALYSRHNPFLYALACRSCAGSVLLPDELVQDTWVRAVELIERFEWRSRFRTWLGGILFNCRREALRGRKGTTTEYRPELDERVGATDAGLDLEDAIARLPEGYRDVVVLHYIYGFKHDEIADMLEIAAGTSKSQASRGIKRLRELVGVR